MICNSLKLKNMDPFKREFRLTEEEINSSQSPEELLDKIEKIDGANEKVRESQPFIRPETQEDKKALEENYKASLKSLEIELSALDALSEQIFTNPDPIQISIYGAKVEDVKMQIESLNKSCKGKGNAELDNLLNEYKARFEEYKMVDIEKLKQRA